VYKCGPGVQAGERRSLPALTAWTSVGAHRRRLDQEVGCSSRPGALAISKAQRGMLRVPCSLRGPSRATLGAIRSIGHLDSGDHTGNCHAQLVPIARTS